LSSADDMGGPQVSPKQGLVRSNLRGLDDTMRSSVAGRTGLVYYALVVFLIFVGLLVIWPILGPTGVLAWFLLLIGFGAAVLIMARRR